VIRALDSASSSCQTELHGEIDPRVKKSNPHRPRQLTRKDDLPLSFLANPLHGPSQVDALSLGRVEQLEREALIAWDDRSPVGCEWARGDRDLGSAVGTLSPSLVQQEMSME
jgi:hypothetical protein